MRTPLVSQEGSSSFVSGSADGRCNLVSSASLNMVSCSAPLLEGGSILRDMMLLLFRVLLATVFTGGPFFFTTLQDEFVGVCQRRDLALRRGVRTWFVGDADLIHRVPEVGGCVNALYLLACSSGSHYGLVWLAAKIPASRPDATIQRRARVYGRLQRYYKCGAV